jgi:hypothetical protein
MNPYLSPETPNDIAPRALRVGLGRPLVLLSISVGCVLLASLFSCMCGHLPLEATFLTVPAVILAAFGRVSSSGCKSSVSIIATVVVGLTSLVLMKNISDVLWFGHDAILR